MSTTLNIRARPDAGSEKVADPLKNDQKVVILDEEDGWYKVRTEVEGWVSSRFIKTNT